MLNLDLASIAEMTHGRLHGANLRVESVSTDSRKPGEHTLFVALRGDNHDAHDFVADAAGNGSVAALVERQLDLDLPQVIVADTQLALGQLAAGVRRQSDVCVIGITGSNGKTTVKSLLAGILEGHAPTHYSRGSFNNEIGLPLTLLAMPGATRFAVLEMGAGKPGDIEYLVSIAQPQVSLVNNVAPAHLERMGSLQGIATIKAAIYAGLPQDGVVVINADDAFAGFFLQIAGSRRTIRFGLGSDAEVSARMHADAAGNSFSLTTPIGEIDVSLPLLGRHNLLNALAAASLALAVDVPLATIKAGLEAATAVAGRSARRPHASGALVIDDSYNANPASFAAAINTLGDCGGRRILVMGDMRELGADAKQLHAEVGGLAHQKGIDALYTVGELSESAAREFGVSAKHFSDQATLIAALHDELEAGVTLLIKGSRGSAMDKVVSALFADPASTGARHAA